MQIHKRVDLVLLERELIAASVPVNGLGAQALDSADPLSQEVFTYDASGLVEDLPPEAVPVVDAHVAPPPLVDYVGTVEQDRLLRTTDAAFHEIWRFATMNRHVYVGEFRMTAVDAGDGTTKASSAVITFKGLASSIVQVGTTAGLWTTQDANASAWAIQAQGQGTDLVIGVRGAAGR